MPNSAELEGKFEKARKIFDEFGLLHQTSGILQDVIQMPVDPEKEMKLHSELGFEPNGKLQDKRYLTSKKIKAKLSVLGLGLSVISPKEKTKAIIMGRDSIDQIVGTGETKRASLLHYYQIAGDPKIIRALHAYLSTGHIEPPKPAPDKEKSFGPIVWKGLGPKKKKSI